MLYGVPSGARRNRRVRWGLAFTFFVAALILAGGLRSSGAEAAMPSQVTGGGVSGVGDVPPLDDGYDALPKGLKALSMSTLVNMGLVHPPPRSGGPVKASEPAHNAPLSSINWGAAINMSQKTVTPGPNEPAAAMHPYNHL